jgi:hypothetical protein
MRTLLAALGAFVLGAISVLIIGSHSFLQRAAAQEIDSNPSMPVVPPLPSGFSANNTVISSGPLTYNLDGRNSINEIYSSPGGVTFRYGGGHTD